MTCGNILRRGKNRSIRVAVPSGHAVLSAVPGSTHQAVIAGLDPAIPIMWRGRASISGMAGSSPAMTIHLAAI
jgi:hypothetical protein